MYTVLEMSREHESHFPTTLLYDFMHLQFISDVFEKIN
jgi:hypothetical protein